MASPGDAEGVTASMGELSVEAAPPSANGGDVASVDEDDAWEDVSDYHGHASTLDREWIHRQNQFQKMGYRDGITEGQKDSAQEGFNVGFRQSVNVGYKWGLVRGVASAEGNYRICTALSKKYQQMMLFGCSMRVFARAIILQRDQDLI